MSTLQERRDRAVTLARAMKEAHVTSVRRRRPNQSWVTDLRPMVEGWRGAMPVVGIMVEDIDRDRTLQAAHAAATGFGCDVVTMTMEGWHPGREFADANPVTGERWGSREGSMQDVVENHRGLERGWVTETIMVMAVNKAGDIEGAMLDYQIVQREGPTRLEVVWGEDRGTPEALGGRVPKVLARAMTQATIEQRMAVAGITPDQFDLTDPVAIQAHVDCGVIKAMRISGFRGALMLLGGETNPVRREIIERSFGNGQAEEWGYTLMDPGSK